LLLASKSKLEEVVEADYQLALLYRDRRQRSQAVKHLKRFLDRAKPKQPYYQDAERLLNSLRI
jgi:hypothetical protein